MLSPALESYLQQVEKYLPPWKSEEILREIRSHALDRAEALAAERGVALDEAILRETLAKFGPPEQLALGYTPPVTLIRPEYTMPFALYALVAVVLLLPFTIFSGLGVWMTSSFLVIGLLFATFLVLSRMKKIYRLPLWHHGFGKFVWHAEIGKGMQKGFETVWPSAATAGAASGTQAQASAWESSGYGVSMSSGSTASAAATPPESATPTSPHKRRGIMDWMISRSGPRPLHIGELIGAGIRIVFGLAIGLYFLFASSPLPLVNVLYEHPRWGWHLLVQAPGFEELRAFGVLACAATALAGLIAIFLGKGRASIYASIASKTAWAVLLFFLVTGGSILSFDFQTTGWVENDWPQVQAGLRAATPIFFFVLFGITLLTLVNRFVKLGLMEAWYRQNSHQEGKRLR